MAINISDLGSIEEAPEHSDDEEDTMPTNYRRHVPPFKHRFQRYGANFDSYNKYMLQYENQMKRYRKNLSRRQDILDYYQQPLHDIDAVRRMVDNVLLRLDQIDKDREEDVLELLRINFTQNRNTSLRQRDPPVSTNGITKGSHMDNKHKQQAHCENNQILDGIISLVVASFLLYIGICLMRGGQIPQPLTRLFKMLSLEGCLRIIFMAGMWPIGLVLYWCFEACYGDPISLIQQEPGMRRMKLTVIAEVEDAEVEEWFDPEEIF